MKFNVKNSEILYEVLYQDEDIKELYTDEKLYRAKDGRKFIEFSGGRYSEYGVKIGFCKFASRKGYFFVDDYDIDEWKAKKNEMKELYPDRYTIIDWEKEHLKAEKENK